MIVWSIYSRKNEHEHAHGCVHHEAVNTKNAKKYVDNLSGKAHVRSKIYLELYHDISYATNEGGHIRI